MEKSFSSNQVQQSLYQEKMNVLGMMYEKYAQDVCRFFCSYTHHLMEAEDMTQDLFLKLAAIDIINEKTFKSLLIITASHMVTDNARHKQFVRRYERDAVAEMERFDGFSVEKKMDRDHLAHVISMRLEKMPSRCADIYTLFFRKEMRTKEIALELNIGVRTVETYIYQSRKELRDYLLQVFK